MSKKLYIGQLSYSTVDASLKEAFSQVGPVEEAVVIMDQMTGRSRGFGFVTMTNDEDAPKAIEMFDGKEFEGRKIVVNEAQAREDRPRRSFGGPRGGGNRFGGDRRGGGGDRGGFQRSW